MNKGIWVTWEEFRRNHGISSGLGVLLYTIESSKPRLLRYLQSIAKTLTILYHEKPDVVFAQNPSTVLGLFLVLVKPFFMKKVVLDSHNTGIYLLEQKYRLLNWASAFIQKKADLTIVTNIGLKREIEGNGGRARVLFDRIPRVEKSRPPALRKGWCIAFVCSFARDEPHEAVFECANYLPEGITIYVTGNFSGKVNPATVPGNVIFTGFLREEDYWGLLQACHLVMDLTTYENCLVCGAYEAIALGKPLILSDTDATKNLFTAGCVYVKPTVESIRDGILKAIAQYEDNLKGIVELRGGLENKWHCAIDALKRETLGDP
jgi:glycosyltransferase involved in cell wall biosynthesis